MGKLKSCHLVLVKSVIEDKIESMSEDAIVVFDDFPDGARSLHEPGAALQ